MLFIDKTIAELELPLGKTKKPWLGWNIVFKQGITPGIINQAKPFIEHLLNKYLEANVDVKANHLITPFRCVMAPLADLHTLLPFYTYTFKVRVYTKVKRGRGVLFDYPKEPVKRYNRAELVGSFLEFPSSSHIATVSIKPPPI